MSFLSVEKMESVVAISISLLCENHIQNQNECKPIIPVLLDKLQDVYKVDDSVEITAM